MAGVRAEAASAAGLSDQRQRLGRRGGGHGTCGSQRAPRGRPPPPGRTLEEAAAEPRWVLAAAGTGELSLNFWSTLCELEPCAGQLAEAPWVP